MGRKSEDDYRWLFTSETGELTEEAIEAIRQSRIKKYRVKTIESGPVVPGGPTMLEVEIFPVWDCQNAIREGQRKGTSEAQQKVNQRNAEKKLLRKINANFTAQDVHATYSYRGKEPSEDQAYRNEANMVRRLRRYCEKHGLEFKAIYVTEFERKDHRKIRAHHHMIMTGIDEKVIKRIWGKGRVHVRPLEPDELGFVALTRYVIKAPHGGKRWRCTKNLIDPEERTNETHIGRRKAEKMALDFLDHPARIMSKRFQEYELIDCEVKRPAPDKPLPGVYVYVRMYKPGGQEKKRRWWWRR